MKPGFDGLFANDALLLTPTSEMMEAMPAYVGQWMIWLMVIGISALILSFKKIEARYIAGAYICSILAGFIVGRIVGAENYHYGSISLLHVIFWTPAVVAILRRLKSINFKSFYGVWLILALATMIFSLVYDWRDAITYLGLIL